MGSAFYRGGLSAGVAGGAGLGGWYLALQTGCGGRERCRRLLCNGNQRNNGNGRHVYGPILLRDQVQLSIRFRLKSWGRRRSYLNTCKNTYIPICTSLCRGLRPFQEECQGLADHPLCGNKTFPPTLFSRIIRLPVPSTQGRCGTSYGCTCKVSVRRVRHVCRQELTLQEDTYQGMQGQLTLRSSIRRQERSILH